MLYHVVLLRSKSVVERCRYRELFHCVRRGYRVFILVAAIRCGSLCKLMRVEASWCKLSWGVTGSAWGDWANYTDSPLRASTQEVLFKGGAGSVDGGMGAGSFGGSKSTSSSSATVSSTDLGVQAPIGYWDPLGLNANADAATFNRRRAVEIKHGRVAMFATMGYIVPEYYKFPGAINSLNFWRTTWSLIWYHILWHIMTYHDLFWRRTWLHDMTLHPASPSWLRFPTWCSIEAACSEMFWDVVRHCEMWCGFCVVLVASCGCEAQIIIRFILVHSYTFHEPW